MATFKDLGYKQIAPSKNFDASSLFICHISRGHSSITSQNICPLYKGLYCWDNSLQGKTQLLLTKCSSLLWMWKISWAHELKSRSLRNKKLNNHPIYFLKSLSTRFNTADDMVWFRVTWLNDLTFADENIRKLPVNIFYSLWFSECIFKRR